MKIEIEFKDGELNISAVNDKKLGTFGTKGKISLLEDEEDLYKSFLKIIRAHTINNTDKFSDYTIHENKGVSK